MSHWQDVILSHFLPATCVSCKNDLKEKSQRFPSVCASCECRVHWCVSSEKIFSSLVELHATAYFEGAFRDMILSFKYSGREKLGQALTRAWLSMHEISDSDIDVIVPVPMAYWKELKRGYNPANVVAAAIGREWEKPVVSNLLGRRWFSPSQTELSRKERFRNAGRSFRLKTSKAVLKSKRVLLVDDVCTTGATLESCAGLLLKAGAKSVCSGVLARERYGA